MAKKFDFGELVVADTAPERGVGLVAETRAADCRVEYLVSGRALWAPYKDLRTARPAEIDDAIEGTVFRLLALFNAFELEFVATADGSYRLAIIHGAIGPEPIDRLRESLGSRLTTCVIRPQGMRRIRTVVEFRG